MAATLTWLIRFVHVAAGTGWVGGYALIAFVLVPHLRKWPEEAQLIQLTNRMMRVLSYTGTLAIIAGAVLIARTRGYGLLLHGEWGALILTGLALAIVLMGIGDGAFRPALRRFKNGDSAQGKRLQFWATTGLVLSLLVVAVMTRAIYAQS